MGDVVYFRADNGITGSELWRTDGTAVGTVLVNDIVRAVTVLPPGILSTLMVSYTSHQLVRHYWIIPSQ